MKTVVLKGFVLSILFLGLGYVSNAQETQSTTHEIKPYKVQVQRIESTTKAAAQKKQHTINKRDQRINNMHALPIEKRATIREVPKPTK
jgi:hypothetical protein